MTTTPKGYLLHISAVSAHAEAAAFAEQTRALGAVCAFDPVTSSWNGTIGALDVTGLSRLNALFQAASRYGTHVRLTVKPAPPEHRGPVLTEIGADLATLLAKEEDRGRPLGQVVG